MGDSRPCVYIGIVGYDRPQLLRQSIESFAVTKGADVRLFVCLNTLQSLHVLMELGDLCAGMMVLDANYGPRYAMNRLYDMMTTEPAWHEGAPSSPKADYLCFAQDDAYARPEWLTHCAAALRRYPDIDIVAGYHRPSQPRARVREGLDKAHPVYVKHWLSAVHLMARPAVWARTFPIPCDNLCAVDAWLTLNGPRIPRLRRQRVACVPDLVLHAGYKQSRLSQMGGQWLEWSDQRNEIEGEPEVSCDG